MLSAVQLEDRGLPAVTVLTATFEDLARQMRIHNKRPELNLLVLPYPLEDEPEDYVRQVARSTYPHLLTLWGVTR